MSKGSRGDLAGIGGSFRGRGLVWLGLNVLKD